MEHTLHMGLNKEARFGALWQGVKNIGTGAKNLLTRGTTTPGQQSMIQRTMSTPTQTVLGKGGFGKSVGDAWQQGKQMAKGVGGFGLKVGLPAGAIGYTGYNAIMNDPVTQQDLDSAYQDAYVATHAGIGNQLQQQGPLARMALGFSPQLAYGAISQATGAQIPAGTTMPSYAKLLPQYGTSAQAYNEAYRNF